MGSHDSKNVDWLIAVHLWDWPVSTNVVSPEELIESYVSERMCNALCIWPDHQPAVFELPLEAIERYDLSVVFNFFTDNVYNWMQSLTWSGGKQDRMEAYVDHWVDAITELSDKRPGKVWWSIGHEHNDQSLAHHAGSSPEEGIVTGRKFSSKQEAYEFYREWVLTDLHKLHWSGGYIRQAKQDRVYKYGVDKDIPHCKYALGNDTGIPSTIPYLKQSGKDIGNLSFGAGGTAAASAPYVYSLGPQFGFFWWECSYVGTGLQPGIAFIRGAAKQYGRKWLMDHSPYAPLAGSRYSGFTARGLEGLGLNSRLMAKGVDDPSRSADQGLGTPSSVYPDEDVTERFFWWPQHDRDGNRLSGLSWQMIQRDWLWSFMSGADCVFQECAAATHFIKDGDAETGTMKVTPYGQAAKEFYAFAADRCVDRGRTVVPITLLMDFYHGIDPTANPGRSSVSLRNDGDFAWGSVPFTEGDHMANLFFDIAFPEHGTWPSGSLPWKNQDEYSLFLRAGLDERPFERRTVVPGAWGDLFDVTLDNADPNRIDEYEAVVVLGDIKLSSAWLNKLRSYVESGGKLLVNAAQIPTEQWSEWLGCSTDGSSSPATRVAWEGSLPKSDYTFDVINVQINDGRVLASTDDGRPVVVSRSVGRGEVWITTPRYLVTSAAPITAPCEPRHRLCEVAGDVLDRFIRPFEQVRLDGKPIARIVNKRSNGDLLITLANPSVDQWIGRIICPGSARSEGRVRDIWNDRSVLHEASGEGLILHLVIPPWGLAVIEIPAVQ